MVIYCDDCGRNEAAGKFDIVYSHVDTNGNVHVDSTTNGRPLCKDCATARKVM